MNDLFIIILSIIISIPCAIAGTYIGLWLIDNFSFYKIKQLIKKEKPKYLL